MRIAYLTFRRAFLSGAGKRSRIRISGEVSARKAESLVIFRGKREKGRARCGLQQASPVRPGAAGRSLDGYNGARRRLVTGWDRNFRRRLGPPCSGEQLLGILPISAGSRPGMPMSGRSTPNARRSFSSSTQRSRGPTTAVWSSMRSETPAAAAFGSRAAQPSLILATSASKPWRSSIS